MRKDVIVHDSPKSPISESIRLLRTNLLFLEPDKKSKVFLVTSSMPGEGKSWVSSNLAISFAQANKKVLLIDGDLRKGRQHIIFGKANRNGLSDYLKKAADLEDEELQNELLTKTINKTGVNDLFIITTGTTPPNPSELLDTKSIDILIKAVSESFDIIIFDMPPVSIVADSLVIADKMDFVVLVSAAEKTKKDILLNSKNSIERVGGKIAGVILNMVPADKRKEYARYYSSYSEDHYEEDEFGRVDSHKKNKKRRR